MTAGFSLERYNSENVFYPGAQSVYVYNSLQDFYDDINRVRPVTLNRFQVRYNNIPGQEKPLQPLEVTYTGAYAAGRVDRRRQDEGHRRRAHGRADLR